jgi:biotin carboxyl carrier protein
VIFLKEKMKINVDNEDFEVFVERNGDTWIVEIEGVSFNVKSEGRLSNSKQSRKRGGSKRKLSGKISSSIPGKIVSLNVSLDQIVEQGEVIMILEAMKMQNEIQAPISGKVVEINCESGDSIEANMPLIIIQPQDSKD